MDSLIIFCAKYLFVAVVLGALIAGIKLPRERRFSYFAAAAISGILAVLLTKLAALTYFDSRPFTHGARALISHAADNGFPSDHTVLSTAAASLAFTANRKFGALLFILALFVGVSRVLAGVHYPIDIIAGLIIGLISAILGCALAARCWNPKRAS